MANIQDFGQKIGGARKDVWKARGLIQSDLLEMNDMERKTHIKKDNIWLKPDWEQLIADGTPQGVAYWQNKMRQAVPPLPANDTEEAQRNYVDVVTKIRDGVMAVSTPEEVRMFYRSFLRPTFAANPDSYYLTIKPEATGIINNKVLKAAQRSYSTMERQAKEKLFGVPKDDKAYVAAKQGLEIYLYDDSVTLQRYPDDKETVLCVPSGWGKSYYYLLGNELFQDPAEWEKDTYFIIGPNRKPLKINFESREDAEAYVETYARAAQAAAKTAEATKEHTDVGGRKKAFTPPQLAHVRYTGPNYRGIRRANSKMFLNDLKFRGGEFGNWLSDNDRQTSLNMAYDALRNLADILGVAKEDVSLNGELAIAFGARGRGGAGAGAAHYEPLRRVINLTKMSGAGCLAHEWGHALDHAIASCLGFTGFASDVKGRAADKLPKAFATLWEKMNYKEVIVDAESQRKALAPKLEYNINNLTNWLNSVKPQNLPEDLKQGWDEIVKRILDNPSAFTGAEYWSGGRGGSVLTNPDVEQLSQISKIATKCVIPRSSKHQICLWARDLKGIKQEMALAEPTKKRVRTDFFNDSVQFDKLFSKHGHGYWQSNCEMFARAFDCYIADKIKESDICSDYLSANADSFQVTMNGRTYYAFPVGEERKAINQCFDALIEELKERGLLHARVEPEVELETQVPEREEQGRARLEDEDPGKEVHYEQLSLDELMFAAASYNPPKTPKTDTPTHNHQYDYSR